MTNRSYTEYAIERISMSIRNVIAIKTTVANAGDPALQLVEDSAVELLQSLETLLQEWRQYSDILDSSAVSYSAPTTGTEGRRARGRPRFAISREQLDYLHALSFSWTEISSLLGVSRMTIYRRRLEYDITTDPQSFISNQRLQEVVEQLQMELPQIGQSMILGRLRSMGYRVTKQRVRDVIRDNDPLNSALRWEGIALTRRPYSVPGPNSLWHIGM